MTDQERKQVRLSLSADVLREFEAAKKRAEDATGLSMTDAEFLMGIVRAEMKRRQTDA
jgi:hypothetical protein